MIRNNLFLKSFVRGFQAFGMHVTTVVNFVLLLIVYFVGIGLTSLFGKAARKRFMELNPQSETYWTELKLSYKKEDYKKMF